MSEFFEGSNPGPCIDVKTLARIEVLTRPVYDADKQTTKELEWCKARARGKALQRRKPRGAWYSGRGFDASTGRPI
jgi:hypothetical protein